MSFEFFWHSLRSDFKIRTVITVLRSVWARFWLSNVRFAGRYGDLRRLYAIRDPWRLDEPKEHVRFAASNAVIRQIAPNCSSLLEVGCGEGLQTRYLLEVSRSVTGIDVSPLAIQRARLNCPEATFSAGMAEDVAKLFPGQRFDLVVAFEVLYYAPDVAMVLLELQKHSDRLLVTNFLPRAEKMRHHFSGAGWTKLDAIVADSAVWECHFWQKP